MYSDVLEMYMHSGCHKFKCDNDRWNFCVAEVSKHKQKIKAIEREEVQRIEENINYVINNNISCIVIYQDDAGLRRLVKASAMFVKSHRNSIKNIWI